MIISMNINENDLLFQKKTWAQELVHGDLYNETEHDYN